VEAIFHTYESDGTIYIFANGGPAGLAEGFATDLRLHPFVSENKKKTSDHKRLRVHCLNESASTITGISNDLGYEHIYVEQLKSYFRTHSGTHKQPSDDLVVGLSGSGNSKNIIRAFQYARDSGATTACITGRDGGYAKNLVDICIVIPGSSTFPGQTGGNDNNFHIEDFQSSVSHMAVGLLKEKVASLNGS